MKAEEFQGKMENYRSRIAKAERDREWELVAFLKKEMWHFRDQALGKVKEPEISHEREKDL